MNKTESIDLKNLVKEYKYETTTDKIRELKHSKKIREEITKMIELKKKYTRLNGKNLRNMVEKQCSFLYKNYTNIFNKIYKDNIDLNLFNKFLLVLEKIEEGKCDQHQASFEVGKILKEIYIDSAMREGNKLDKKNKKKPEKTRKAKSIGWNEFKKMNSE
jgi:predicted O-linked N-acetylglucosamine transferase (SPINDLY family)